MPEILDRSAIDQLISDVGPDIVPVVIQAVLTDIDERGGRIVSGLKGGDLEIIAMEAHALKSATRSVGLAPMSDLYGRLETAARDGDVAATSDIAGQLELILEPSRQALQSLLKE